MGQGAKYVSAHASAASSGATSSILRPRAWFAGGCLALLALVAWFGVDAGASRAAAPECPNEAIRIAQGATRLPDCRAYERVSPADGTGGVVGVDTKNRPMFGTMRADGDGAAFASSSAIGDVERGAVITSNLAHRSAAGWNSFGVLTTTAPSVPMDISMAPSAPIPSADMTRMMFRSSRSLGPPNPIATGGSIYLSAPEGKGAPTWLSRWTLPGTQPAPISIQLPLGGAPDLSSGYFRYTTALTSLAGDDLRNPLYGIYHFEGETIAPAGVLPSGMLSPDGALPAGTLQVTSSGSGGNLAEQARNQVSADGSKLFFVSPAESAEPKQLYVQEGAAPGRLISHDIAGDAAPAGITELTGIDGPGTGASGGLSGYAYATPDGSRVLFRSTSALTADAPAEGNKTYRAEITPSSIDIEYLPAVDGYPAAITDDASTVLFSTRGSDIAYGDYYLWDEGRPGGAPYTIATEVPTSGGKAMYEPRLSADGSVVVFASNQELEPGMTPLMEASYTQVYRWTTQDETMTCISCRRDGGLPGRFGSHLSNSPAVTTDNPSFPNGSNSDPANQSTVVGNRKISSDGSRVFFDTNDPLDPARDVNGVRDVYMWENGKAHLLTSGRNSVPSLILDSSRSGDDVMLVTMDGLVPSDTNQTYDVYDVRVDGGFDESLAADCAGDACQGQGSAPRQATVPGSSIIAWVGSTHESRKGQARSRKALTTTQLGRPGSSSARIRIQVPAAGKVSIAGSDVKAQSRQVKGGTVVVAVGLSQAGKQKLARKGQLKTTVKVTFRPSSGAVTKKSMKLSFVGPKGAR